MTTIAVVGQTPPPFGGQAVMIERLLAGEYSNVRLVHVRMAFSKELDAAGKFASGKLLELLRVLVAIVFARIIKGAQVLYYPPAGPSLIPVLRDIFLLGLTRWMFSSTIFHFHAGGLSQIYHKLPPPLQILFKIAYCKPDAAIRVANRAPKDAQFLRAKREFVVPNGIEDCAAALLPTRRTTERYVRILFVGVLREDKGLLVLIRACSFLRAASLNFRLVCLGTFESKEFRTKVVEYINTSGLSDYVDFPGALVGDAKWGAYLASDIFCFPSFFDAETFGIVLLEAMSFALPIVCTDWRGIPDVVDDQCAFIVPIKHPSALADRLRILIENPGQRRAMGIAGRKRFLDQFTAERYFKNLQLVFDHLAARSEHS